MTGWGAGKPHPPRNNRATQLTSLPSWEWLGQVAVPLSGSTHRPHSKAHVTWKDLSQLLWLQSIHTPGLPHKQHVCGVEWEGRGGGGGWDASSSLLRTCLSSC